jgi:hypothetical protein
MKPDASSKFKLLTLKISRTILVFLLLSVNNILFSQEKLPTGTVSPSQHNKPSVIPWINNLFHNNTRVIQDDDSIPAEARKDNSATPLFFDSIRFKASKRLVTRKLYDLVIVSNKPASKKRITESSESDFLKYSGWKIRNISIRQIDVFGSNINNPAPVVTDKTSNFLNKTHLNTNEFIIRKNLLISEGDTISPLVLSDNERLLRRLPFIDDSRIVIVPADGGEADIIVLTKDVYSLGASFDYTNLRKGSLSLFEKNIMGIGHEFRLDIPYDGDLPDSPGFGIQYKIDNIARSFINMNLFYSDGLGAKTYGFSLSRKLVSTATRYAGGISFRKMLTTEDLDKTLPVAEPLRYNLQDYWFSRSVILDQGSATRLILGARYTNNNVFEHPVILPDSYHYLQRYKLFLGSAAISLQRFYKTNLIYSHGHTEDIPYGGLLNFTFGKEINEFKNRFYTGMTLAAGRSLKSIGYLYTSFGLSGFINGNSLEEGLISIRSKFFSNLLYMRNSRLRNFVTLDYTKGLNRNIDEYLVFYNRDGFSGFRNDSLRGNQRLSLSIESVIFSPLNLHGFRFAYFAFAEVGLIGSGGIVPGNHCLSSLGLGIRIRNDNLVFNTFQVRLGFYPNLPLYSKVNNFTVSGKQVLDPADFDPSPPSILPFN